MDEQERMELRPKYGKTLPFNKTPYLGIGWRAELGERETKVESIVRAEEQAWESAREDKSSRPLGRLPENRPMGTVLGS